MIEIGLDAVAALDELEQDPALAVLRLGDAEQVREGRREVDRAGRDRALGDALATGQERRPHVDVVGEVLDVRARSRAGRRSATARRACPGVAASNWYGGYANTTTSPVRVGWAMSVVVPRPFGM